VTRRAAGAYSRSVTSTALIVIDVQEEYFSGALPIEYPNRDDSLARIEAAVAAARLAEIPVIVVRHSGDPGEGSFEPGTPGWELRPEISAIDADLLVDKRLPGAFTGTELASWMEANSVDHLTIAGYMTNVCCDTTARQALHRSMGATLLHDALGVPAMPGVDGAMIDAEQLHLAALAPLRLIGVELVTTEAWIASLVS
jgi:nicotinamidase-related amidase